MKCWKCGAQMMLDGGEPFCLTCGNRSVLRPVMSGIAGDQRVGGRAFHKGIPEGNKRKRGRPRKVG